MNRERRNMTYLALVCALFLPPVLAAWMVNMEMAVRVWMPDYSLLQSLLPARMFDMFARTAIDLSAITTLTPLLMLLFPLVQAVRVLKNTRADPAFAHKLEADPYPAHFAFFLVMLGLTGTLYGLFIGLHISGVPELAQTAPTAETIRVSLERLLAGTATALLSSLAGLTGAFLAARPIPWLFRKLAGVTPDEGRRTVTETIERLTEDLRGLSQASRAFSARLRPQAVDSLFDRMDRHETAMHELREGVQSVCTVIERLALVQEQTNEQLRLIAGLEKILQDGTNKFAELREDTKESVRLQSNQTEKLGELERALQSILTHTEENGKRQDRLIAIAQKTGEQANEQHKDNAMRHSEMLSAIGALTELAGKSHDSLLRDQRSLKDALSTYIKAETGNDNA